VGYSIALRVFKNLWETADKIVKIHEAEVKIAGVTGLLQSSTSPLSMKLTQHASRLRAQLSKKLQELEEAWRKEEEKFEIIMENYDFDCYDIFSIAREMKNTEKKLRTVEKEYAAISKVCSSLKTIPGERQGTLFSLLLAYYGAFEANLIKQRETLRSLHRHLYRFYENVFKYECEELVKQAFRGS